MKRDSMKAAMKLRWNVSERYCLDLILSGIRPLSHTMSVHSSHLRGKSVALIPLLLVLASTGTWALPYDVRVGTPALSGTPAQLAFDFINGDSSANSVTISAFATNGALGSFSITGDVTGSLPGSLVLRDTSFFNEYLQNSTLGTDLSFLFETSTNAPAASSFPDAFSFFVLNSTGTASLFPTTDPTGADALFKLDITGTSEGTLTVYTATGGEAVISVATAIPEPATIVLLSTGLAGWFWFRRRAGV
jgi:hypothetical protein